MHRDLAQLENGAQIETDIAVVGAGAAGITIAHELVNSRCEVLLVESGGFAPEPAVQALDRGAIVGLPYTPLEQSRVRFFGGTTNVWHGHCRPLDAIDFERRSWVPYSGWPIARNDLDPYYRRAQRICELGGFRYDPAQWPGLSRRLLDFAPEKLVNRLWLHGPRKRFGEAYRAELVAAKNVHILTHANAVGLAVDSAARRVLGVTLKALDGRQATIRPKAVVLACGGIENARLLLASDGVAKGGVGNGHGLVGRFFGEVPNALAAFAVRQVPLARFAAYYDAVRAGAATINVKPGVPDRVQRQRQLLNGCLDVGYGYDRSEGYLALRSLIDAASDHAALDSFGQSVIDVISDLDGAIAGLYRRVRGEDVLWFAGNFEQAPNPDSRVTLGTDRDAIGMREVRLDWRLGALDKYSLARGCRLLGEELARLGVARLRMDTWLHADGNGWQGVAGRYVQAGTTRMSDDPRRGVVDPDCRVYGMANLFVAGASVFPTVGYAYPMLTLVALAIRLADHLKDARRN